ncbi:MAG: hypothetical protein AB4038_21730 [Prochloraceae cyanobacterium]
MTIFLVTWQDTCTVIQQALKNTKISTREIAAISLTGQRSDRLSSTRSSRGNKQR